MASTSPSCECWACRNCTCESEAFCYPCSILEPGDHPDKDPTYT